MSAGKTKLDAMKQKVRENAEDAKQKGKESMDSLGEKAEGAQKYLDDTFEKVKELIEWMIVAVGVWIFIESLRWLC